MDTECSSGIHARAALHAALSDPARLAIVDQLTFRDLSPTEIRAQLEMPSNLLAHHLNKLEQAGVIARTRSEGDRRRTYLHLRPGVLSRLTPSADLTAARVVFVCTQNSARSQLAAALWPAHSPVPAASAGTQPAKRVHPRAAATARRHGLDLDHRAPQHLDQVLHGGDLIIAVCDHAHESLRGSATDPVHWSIADPARPDTDDAFEQAYTEITGRIARMAPAIHPPGDTRA